MIQTCDLFKQIPKEKLEYLFKHSDASGELDATFLGFEDPYRVVKDIADKDMVIIDFGCAYAAQSWYFRDHVKYIGVDGWSDKDSVIHTENSEYYFTTIQDFIKRAWPVLQYTGMTTDNVFAVCSAVPDKEAREMVLTTFKNCLDWYPCEKVTIKQNGEIKQYQECELFDFKELDNDIDYELK